MKININIVEGGFIITENPDNDEDYQKTIVFSNIEDLFSYLGKLSDKLLNK